MDPTQLRQVWSIQGIPATKLGWGSIRGNKRHECPYCKLPLLTGEKPGFCCGPKGSKLADVPPLPPLPAEFDSFISNEDVSKLSRSLNLILSFAALETTHTFPHQRGPPGFFAIEGRVYHRVRPSHDNSSVKWLLYDAFMAKQHPHADKDWAAAVPMQWLESFTAALIRVNPFVIGLRHLSKLDPVQCPTAHLILEDGGADEIAAIVSYDNTTQSEVKSRRIIVSRQNGENQAVSSVSRLWEPLSYPLFFPQGTLGWGLHGSSDNFAESSATAVDTSVTTTQMWHYRARLLREPRFQIFGKLTNKYLVDMFTRDLECRLAYIAVNQYRLRQEDAILMGLDAVDASENVYLPASFLGSRQWASDQVADSLTIAAALGPPTFFITMTCNPYWDEISSQLRPGQQFTDIPVVVVRVFKRKLALLQKTLKTMFVNAGRQLYSIHCVEFQKRGLPHAHILLKYFKDCTDPDAIDAVVSAEMPTDIEDANLVRKFMMHSHPAQDKPPSKYCQKDNDNGTRSCRFKYPPGGDPRSINQLSEAEPKHDTTNSLT